MCGASLQANTEAAEENEHLMVRYSSADSHSLHQSPCDTSKSTFFLNMLKSAASPFSFHEYRLL